MYAYVDIYSSYGSLLNVLMRRNQYEADFVKFLLLWWKLTESYCNSPIAS